MPSKQKAGYGQHTSPYGLNTDLSVEYRQPDIVNVLWSLKKKGKREATIKNIGKYLRLLAKGVNLNDPEKVKEFIACLDKREGYKRNLVMAYQHYVDFKGLTWSKPIYYQRAKLPKIPTEEKLDMIISASSKKLALKLLISKETGLRPIEVVGLKVRDIDFEKGVIYPETAKHGNARTLRLKPKTLDLLRAYITKHGFGNNDLLFEGKTSEMFGKAYRNARNRLAAKLGDTSIKTIRLYNFRHFFATMTYHKTKDILYTKQQMGHRKIETTLIYTQLVNFESDEWTACVAKNVEEACKLVEAGFEYVTGEYTNGGKIFRKRK